MKPISEIFKEGAKELSWLKGEYGEVHATPSGPNSKDKEYQRTICSVMLLWYVLANMYEKFCECQPEGTRISRNSFNRIRKYVKSVLKTEDDENAMAIFLVINDIGKVEGFVKDVAEKLGFKDVDHDIVMYEGLRNYPELSSSFAALYKRYQDMILEGMGAFFNFGQFVQAECLPGSLTRIKNISQAAYDWYMIHVLFDIAGAAGHVNPNGSLVFTEIYTKRFFWAKEALDALREDKVNEQGAYMMYLQNTAKLFNMGVSYYNLRTYAVARLLNLFLVNTEEDAKKVEKAFLALPYNMRMDLEGEMSRSGMGGDLGVLLYYLPSTLTAALGFYKKEDPKNAIETTMFTILPFVLKLYQLVRVMTAATEGVVVADITDVVEVAKTPEKIHDVKWSFVPVKNDYVVKAGEVSNACLTFRA